MKHLVLASAVLLSLAITTTGKAGDGTCVPTLVNMTPDGSGEAARTCAANIRRTIRRMVGGPLPSNGESRFRARVVAAGDDAAATSDFFDWNEDALDALVRGPEAWESALFLFDCQPERHLFRAVVVPRGPGNVRTVLRGPLMTLDRVTHAVEGLMGHQAIGWDP